MNSQLIYRIVLAGLVAALPIGALAQAYPSKPIRSVLTVGAGGGGDAAARLIGQKLFESMGQAVVIDPQGGAAGAVGAEMVARAAPDGYTILYAISSTMILRRFLTKNTTYDTLRDFTPIIMLGETVSCVVAGPSIPGNTLAEVIDYARRNPGKVSYGTSGIGTTHHLAGEIIQGLTGIRMVHVPYKSGTQGGTDAVSGRIQLMFNIMGSLQAFVSPGKLRVLAINNNKRYHRMPEIPTIAEVIPGYERAPSWTAYFGPANLPAPILKRLYDELNRAASAPDIVAKLDGVGMSVDTLGPAEFAATIKQNMEQTARLMKAAGVEPE